MAMQRHCCLDTDFLDRHVALRCVRTSTIQSHHRIQSGLHTFILESRSSQVKRHHKIHSYDANYFGTLIFTCRNTSIHLPSTLMRSPSRDVSPVSGVGSFCGVRRRAKTMAGKKNLRHSPLNGLEPECRHQTLACLRSSTSEAY